MAQDGDRQQISSNILSLELAKETDFTVLKDSINYYRSVLKESDLIEIYTKAVNQSRQIKNDSLFFYFVENLSYTNLVLTAYDEAIATGHTWIDHATAIKDTNNLVLGLSRQGVCYLLKDNTVRSLEYYLKALNLAKAFGDKKLENHVSINLSSCYDLMGREDDAASLIKNTITNYYGMESIEALNALVVSYTILFDLKVTDSLEIISIIKELDDVTYKLENHKNIGTHQEFKSSCSQAYFHLFSHYLSKTSNIEKTENYYHKLLNSDFALDAHKYIASFRYALKKKDLITAKKFLKKKEENIYGESYYDCALEYYELTGDFEQQLHYSNLYKDAIIEKLRSDKVNLNTFIKVQLENVEQAKEVSLLQREVDSQNLQRMYLFSISFLLGGLLLSILYAFQQIRKRNKSLNAQKSIIEKQATKLKAVNKQKSIFFANVAHEFQTPLSIITGLAKKVKSLDKIEDAKPLLPIIIRNGTQLSEFTTQILELTKNEETSHALNQNFFHLGELINYQVHELQHLADSKNITIELQNTLDKQVIFSDVHKFKTIIKNLISNAIKYSPLNSTINLKLNSVDEKNIALTISDNGKGIAQEDLVTIFDRFYQSNSEKEDGGFGIGLAICKEYTQALGGHIEAQSILGQGSQFVLQLPTNINGQEIEDAKIQKFPIEEYIEKTLLTNQNNQDKSILIVEDNLDFCKYLSSILVSRYQLVFFHNGYDALDHLKSESPDLIITDWMLPEMDGLEFVKTLKESSEGKQIPVLMLTARGMITDELKALREGIDDYLVKTFDEEILIQRIKNLLLHANTGMVLKPRSLNDASSSPSNRIVENISKQDQEWLLQFERSVTPRLQAFELNLEEIASLMSMSISQLGRKMKSITGITPKKYIQEMRFWEARRILELGLVDSVKAACLSVGFKDQSHFSKKFKEKFGIYPSDLLN